MERLTGKTFGILRRLAHFYDPDEAGQLLLLFVEIFGRRLEHAERDLYRVLRAHHVETADNEGSQGYIAAPDKRGDLDKIFALYLSSVGGTSQLVKTNQRFSLRSFDARRLGAALLAERTPLADYLRERFAPATWDLLGRYDASGALLRADAISAGLVAELVLQTSAFGTALAARLARRAPEVHAALAGYGGEATIAAPLAALVADGLNAAVLRDPHFFPAHEALVATLPLPPAAWALIHSLYRELLRERYGREPNLERRAQLLALLEHSEPAPAPAGDDAIRLNRLILDAGLATLAGGWTPRAIPTLDHLRQALADELNRLLDDPALFRPERFPDLDEELLGAAGPADLVRFNRQLLESAWPYAIEKSYVPYRERLLGLIEVLKRGAATRQGIVDIVAANLGIVGDDPAVLAARATIEIEEFLPQRALFYKGALGFYEEFEVRNDNLSAASPQVWITMLAGPIRALVNLQLIDIRRGQRVLFPGRIEAGDRLSLEGGAVLRNGIVPAEGLIGAVPDLRPGAARWRFSADVELADGSVHPAGAFNRQRFDRAVFVPDEPLVQVEVASQALTYGVFTVTIPWHIPGFTDKFEGSGDHPRQQILTLVNRVKAAGVEAIIAYKQGFAEDHGQDDRLDLAAAGDRLAATHDIADALAIDSRQANREDHAIGDALVLAGRFDYTSFDSLNSFA